ncbi:hypothetical protein Taro_030804 [Colocasia esculenta]|uniref:non-specific serine/threonine protein kinase n=1 Tax=Colocasia esculenta TaxID=4460 RepID=A0A843W4F5_COLES|nr:hypothetical protein [Colocasia esculenta]
MGKAFLLQGSNCVENFKEFNANRNLLGTGAVKKVYREFDQEEGIEVAWNQVHLYCFTDDPKVIEWLYSEVQLLRSLRHGNNTALHHVWGNAECGMLNFITEALKKWSQEIPMGLEYLHTHDPCIIHHGINCSNIFINGNISQLIPASIRKNHAAHSKVTDRMRSVAMDKVRDLEVKNFIERCLGSPRAWPSATDLLKDCFFYSHDDEDPRVFLASLPWHCSSFLSCCCFG